LPPTSSGGRKQLNQTQESQEQSLGQQTKTTQKKQLIQEYTQEQPEISMAELSCVIDRFMVNANQILEGHLAKHSFGNSKIGNIAMAASDDDTIISTPKGVWVQPYYAQSNQKTKNSFLGYNGKSTGGVIGFDANANENLILGGAVVPSPLLELI